MYTLEKLSRYDDPENAKNRLVHNIIHHETKLGRDGASVYVSQKELPPVMSKLFKYDLNSLLSEAIVTQKQWIQEGFNPREAKEELATAQKLKAQLTNAEVQMKKEF